MKVQHFFFNFSYQDISVGSEIIMEQLHIDFAFSKRISHEIKFILAKLSRESCLIAEMCTGLMTHVRAGKVFASRVK